jgi:DNA-binding NarL/FixJ family response regulator
MPGMSGAALADLLKEYRDVPVAVVSGTASSADVRAVVEAGVRAFIPKTAGPDYFAHALQMLIAGGTSVPTDMLFDQPAPAGTEWLARLTSRERDVLRGLLAGKSNKEIGRELNLAEVTVKLHLRNVFRKMEVKSRSEAAVMAVKAGLG